MYVNMSSSFLFFLVLIPRPLTFTLTEVPSKRIWKFQR
uniref:Uncharacterized protein n=1 Tax=Rhizophora mucronata TaxID=61149 RepID=A0A2P2J8I9_RHIMU